MRLGKYNRNPVVNATFLVESSAGQYKQIVYKQPDEAMSSGRDTFIANLGYTEEPVSSITITLPTMGVYTFKNIRVYYVPMDGYEEKIAKLQENKLTKVKIGIDYLRGEIEAPAPRMLCVAIPYSDGWKGTIDGEEAEVHCINEHYLGMYVPEGKHDIYLHYQTPYNREGALISLLGAVALFAVCLFERKKRCRAGQ